MVRGHTVRGMVDGQLTHDVTLQSPAPHPKLCAGSGLDQRSGDLFVKVINISATLQDTVLTLACAPRAYTRFTAMTLAGDDPLAENTYAEPFKLAPVESTLALPATGATVLRQTFPSYFVTVLRLQTTP